jgi:hypothetical protein
MYFRGAVCVLLLSTHHSLAWTVGLTPSRRHDTRFRIKCCQEPVNAATLLDPDSGKTLRCLVAGTVVVEVPDSEDEVYGALYPADTPITLAMIEDDELEPLNEGDERALFPMAERACKDIDVELLDTPVLLTAKTTPELENMMMNADDLPSADEEVEDDEDEAEEAMLLTAFEHEGDEIFVMKPLDPMFIVGKQTSDATIFVVPTTEEIDAVTPLVEELLQSIEDDQAEDLDDAA